MLTAEIPARSLANFHCQLVDRHDAMRQGARVDNLTIWSIWEVACGSTATLQFYDEIVD